MTDTVTSEDIQHSGDLAEQYTDELNAFVDKLVPPILDDMEYAARCSALLIALNRQLARCASAFGLANGVEQAAIRAIVLGQFDRNYRLCLDAIDGAGATVQ
jgi:hypothetical protein